MVEITCTVSRRVRRIAAHDPHELPFAEYFRELNRVPKLAETAKKYVPARHEYEQEFWMEMILEGMHPALRMAREDLDSTITFHELMKFNVLRTVK